MFATITRAARSRTLSTVDEPDTLAWRTVGAAWTVWLAGWVLGPSSWYWGSLLVVSALWITTATVDRLQRFGAVGHASGSVVRAALLGVALVWAPRAIVMPAADLAAWATVLITAAAAHLAAPWIVATSDAAQFWRWWDDLKASAAYAGGLVAAPIFVVAAISSLGYEVAFTIDQFRCIIAGAAFCVVPTVLSLRSASADG